MSPRRRPKQAARSAQTARTDAAAAAYQSIEPGPDGDYVVRNVTGSAATKPYRCPGCQQLIPPATPHVVAWPVDGPWHDPDGGGLKGRRHWHTGCWRSYVRGGRPR